MTESERYDAIIQRILEAHRSGRILVIDDQPSMRRVCTFALRGEGYHAEGETSPIRALNRLLAGERFDAIVLDHAMAEMEGLDVIRSLLPGQHPPVVFASAHAGGGVARDALCLGVWDFITKPFTPAALRRSVQRLLLRANLVAQGDKRALALHLANRRRWEDALRVLEGAESREDRLLRGLLCDVAEKKEEASQLYAECGWPSNWAAGDHEIWSALAQRLDC